MALGMKNIKLTAVISITALVLFNTAYGAETSPTDRPESWAKPIEMQGVPTLHKVSDTLYRSAQPSAEGMTNPKATVSSENNQETRSKSKSEVPPKPNSTPKLYEKPE